MEKQLFLDISKSDVGFFRPGDPTLLPLKKSRTKGAFDIVNDDLPRDFVDRMYGCLFDRPGLNEFVWVDDAIRLPICVRLKIARKHGARIVSRRRLSGSSA